MSRCKGAAVVVAMVAMAASPTAAGDHTPLPATVTLVGSLQSELGASGDWQPEAVATRLTYDAGDDVWQGTFALPPGAWEYKVVLNGTWDENYGLHAEANGPNIALNLSAPTAVKFYYDHKTHWVTDNRNSVIAVVPGSFQSELGCPGDWQPDCLRSWLQDPDGDGVYSLVVRGLPPGVYEAKVAIGETWDINYGAGGVEGGPNIPFTAASEDLGVRFTFDSGTHLLRVTSTADINIDGVVDARDVQLEVNAVLGIPISEAYAADVNGDSSVDARDVQLVVNALLGIA